MYCDRNSNDKMKVRKSLFLWSFLLIALMATVAAGASASGGQPAQMIDKFEVEEDFGVRKALAMLGSQCQKNIVPSPNVDGVLAFRSLNNVTFEEAMDAILGENFRYEQVGQLIKVYTKDEYQKLKNDPARKVHEVFTLYYITGEEAEKLIKPVLSEDAVIQSSTASEKTISGSSGSGSSGGSSSGSGGGSLGSGGGGDSLALNDKIVVYDFPEKIEMARGVIKSLDIKPKQVLIEATILRAMLDENTQFGIDLSSIGGASISLGSTEGIQDTGFASVVSPGGLTAVFSIDDVTGFIRALEEVTDTTVLANTKILAVNKQQGAVLIGQKMGYQSQITQTDGGTTTSKVDFLESGTRLVFRPYIGNDGYIRMDIYPEDSTATLNPITQIPDKMTTELQTNVLVKDGETIVIGGLFRDYVSTTRSQVPLLGDIPFLGALFRGTSDLTQRVEVIILLTPHIIEEPEDTGGDQAQTDIDRKTDGVRKGLQWIGRRKLAEDRYIKAARYYVEGNTEAAIKELEYVLSLRPTYLEAIRLKEKIIAELSPEEAQKMDRIILKAVESEDIGI